MAESSDSSSCIESDGNSILSGSVNYSTDYSDNDSISDLSISAETEVLPYHFERLSKISTGKFDSSCSCTYIAGTLDYNLGDYVTIVSQ